MRYIFSVITIGILALLFAADQDPKEGSSTKLPRILPLEPRAALKTFQFHGNFKMELVASEPLIRDPVAMAFDENGILYVVEYPEYNQYAKGGDKATGAIKRLVDTNGDGRYDKATVFLDKVDSPTAIACWDGGLFVGVVPDILYCKDTNGNGRADIRKRVFTGFSRDRAGEAMLNSFRWGIDNRFHVSTSLAGGNIQKVGAKGKPLSVKGRGLLIDPRSLDLEVTSGGGQHGMSMDDWGNKFVCANSEPVTQLMYDDRYLARNPMLKAPKAAVNIAPGGKYTKVFRASRVEPWRILRTDLRAKGKVPGPKESGKPSGFFTGATGITVYRGDAWPMEYRGNIYVGEVSGNLVYRARLVPNGIGFTALRAGNPKKEFLASTDNWFRPVQFAHGPDGNLYIVDMYRELIEGAAFLPPQVLKHMDVSAGIKRGRIYRIVHNGSKRRPVAPLGRASTLELVKLLSHTNGWHRDTASRLIYQRQDRRAISPLRDMAQKAPLPQGRLHALWALQGLGALRPEDLRIGLKDKDARVREGSLRLAERVAIEPLLQKEITQMASDPSLRVRHQLAFTLGSLEGEECHRALMKLTRNFLLDPMHSKSPWIRVALLSSMGLRRGESFRALAQDQAITAGKVGQLWLKELAGQIGRANRKGEVALFLESFASIKINPSARKQILSAFLSGQPQAVREKLANGSGALAGLLASMIKEATTVATDHKAAPQKRAEAIRAMALADVKAVKSIVEQCLDQRQPLTVQRAALEVAGQFSDKAMASMILKSWKGLSPRLRSTAAETLFSRSEWLSLLLDAIEKGVIARSDLEPSRAQIMASHPDKAIRDRVKRLFMPLARREKVFEQYRQALDLKGSIDRGKALFKKHCSACHRLEGVGESVGADLSAIRDRGAEGVLLNILDPNREVKPQFVSYYLETEAGKVLAGMVTQETANSVTIRRPDGKSETILRGNIAEIRSTGMSFMPEGLEKEIDIRSMADLLAYLMSKR